MTVGVRVPKVRRGRPQRRHAALARREGGLPHTSGPATVPVPVPIARAVSVPASRPARVVRSGGPPRWALSLMRRQWVRWVASFVGAAMCLGLFVVGSGVAVTRGDVGTVGVVRNGGPFDARTIRQVIMPGQGLTYTGMFSEAPHEYPASHVTLKYTVTGQPPDKPQSTVDTITLPTKDGVEVGIDAAVFFRFVGESDLEVLQKFDRSVGTRQFLTPDGKERLFAWNGTEGFSAMLDALFRPVLENDLRVEVGRHDCAALVASCALVQNAAGIKRAAPSVAIARIEQRINTSLERDLHAALSQPFFWDIRFVVSRVTLPKDVQAAVDDAQTEFTAVNSARAKLRQARYLARSNRLLGATYNESKGLATIEAMKAIPKGSSVIVSTGGRAPRVLAGAR